MGTVVKGKEQVPGLPARAIFVRSPCSARGFFVKLLLRRKYLHTVPNGKNTTRHSDGTRFRFGA